MKTLSFVTLAACAMAAATAGSAQTTPALKARASVPERHGRETIDLFRNGKTVNTVACRDFNMLDETLRPQAVVYAENYGPKGKAHPTITIDEAARVMPVVVDSCKAEPGNHFAATVRAAMNGRRMR